MEAKDGSFGFDFEAVYDAVIANSLVAYTFSDGRQIETRFEDAGLMTKISTRFDAEEENSVELQRTGWQAILDNFKKYAQSA